MHAPGKQSNLLPVAMASQRIRIHRALASASALALLLFCAIPALAAQASKSKQRPAHQADVEAVHSVVSRLSKALANQDAKGLTRLFSRDAEVRLGSQIVADGPAGLLKAFEQPPFSETTPFHVVRKSVRILAPGLAIVYGELVQYGAVIVRRALPVQLVLRQTDSEWRIVSFWLPNPGLFPPAQH